MSLNRKKEETHLVAFRMPTFLWEEAVEKCVKEDLTFSQLMRRAVRRELGLSPIKSEESDRGE